MHIWSTKDLTSDAVQIVRFRDGGLFTILRDRTKRAPTYSLGDELGRIDGAPQNLGPMSEELTLAVLNSSGAKLISFGDAAQIRADHRVSSKGKADASRGY